MIGLDGSGVHFRRRVTQGAKIFFDRACFEEQFGIPFRVDVSGLVEGAQISSRHLGERVAEDARLLDPFAHGGRVVTAFAQQPDPNGLVEGDTGKRQQGSQRQQRPRIRPPTQPECRFAHAGRHQKPGS